MKSLGIYLKEYRKESILGPLFKLLEASFELLVPLVVASIIDHGIESRDRAYIMVRCFLLAGLGLVGFLCSVTAQYYAARAAVGCGTRLRHALFSHIQELSFADCDGIGTAALITRMTSDVNQVQSGINLMLRLFLRSPFIVAGAVVMAYSVNRQAANVFLALVFVLSLVVFLFIRMGVPLYQRVQSGLDRVMRVMRDNLSGVRVIRAFRREAEETEHFKRETDDLLRTQLFTGRVSGLLNPLTLVAVNLAIIVLLYTGAVQVAAGILTRGAVIALVNYMSQILIELVKMANLMITITKAFASGKRIEEIMDIRVSGRPSGEERESKGACGEDSLFLQFSKVSFQYPGAGEEALTKIDLCVKRGETIGIIGGTGSGKTTLINLLPGFYAKTGGNIYVNGKEICTIDIQFMRDRIGMVPQKAVLFRGTIRENLLWGRETATEEEVWEALRIAQADGFIRQLQNGLEGKVEQEGRNFSGGQRQRLSIARALVRKPEILILDDCTSALDFMTEAALWEMLKKAKGDMTILITSQRSSSVLHGDRILVLDDGKAAGIGTHKELLEDCLVYREIYESQFGS